MSDAIFDRLPAPLGGRSSDALKIRPGAAPEPPEPLAEACRDFEAVFVRYMLQQMRRSVPRNALFDGGRAEEIYTSMMDGELARSIAQQRGIGLASILLRQLSMLHDSAAAKKNFLKSEQGLPIPSARDPFAEPMIAAEANKRGMADGDGRKKEDDR